LAQVDILLELMSRVYIDSCETKHRPASVWKGVSILVTTGVGKRDGREIALSPDVNIIVSVEGIGGFS
jgi:hypothetical protein